MGSFTEKNNQAISGLTTAKFRCFLKSVIGLETQVIEQLLK